MSDAAEDFIREHDLIACETMALRDWLDNRPFFVEIFTETEHSPWRDGANIVVTDLLKFKGDRVQLLMRLFAWFDVLGGPR